MLIGKARLLYRALGWAQWTVGVFGALLAGLLKAPPEKLSQLSETLGGVVIGVQENTWWLLPLTLVIIGVLNLVKSQIGPPWVWDAVHRVLTQLRNDVFSDCLDEPIDHHRVTLFRKLAWWNPFHQTRKHVLCGRLVAVCRSGHLAHSRIDVFPVPDRPECEPTGVAARSWRCHGWVVPKDLPEITAEPTDEQIEKYAMQTFTTAERVRQRMEDGKPLAGGYAALQIEVKGRPWGVVVLDSKKPFAWREHRRYTLVCSVLSPLLEHI